MTKGKADSGSFCLKHLFQAQIAAKKKSQLLLPAAFKKSGVNVAAITKTVQLPKEKDRPINKWDIIDQMRS